MDIRLAEELPRRRERLSARLEEEGVDALFVPPSADLEYLTGVERDLPSFGEINYAHGWVTGAFLTPGRDPLFVLPGFCPWSLPCRPAAPRRPSSHPRPRIP